MYEWYTFNSYNLEKKESNKLILIEEILYFKAISNTHLHYGNTIYNLITIVTVTLENHFEQHFGQIKLFALSKMLKLNTKQPQRLKHILRNG